MTINPTIPYWTPTASDTTEGRLRDCLAVLANRRQRAILRVLTDYSPSLSIADLVRRLVALERETTAADVAPADETAVEISLAHVDLPQLAAARFVTANSATSTVSLLDHPLLDDPHVERLIARDDLWDDRIALMAVRRHRLIRAILADYADPLPRDRLAALVCARECSPEPHVSTPTGSALSETPPAAAVAAMGAALHHVHLPTLADAGLVVYDPEAGTVAYRHTPGLDDDGRAAAFPTATDTHYPVDCTTDGLAIRLVVTPDGRVGNAFACAIDESTVRTVTVATRSPTGSQQSRTPPPAEAAAATPNRKSTPQRQEQWLIDCWLRQHTAS